ncbi:MAG: S-layer homology domain-containing protein [Monoglobaceae bacterium]
MRKSACICLCLMLLTASFVGVNVHAEDDSYAELEIVRAECGLDAAGVSYLADGDSDTVWNSDFAKVSGQEILFDLGETMLVSEIEIEWVLMPKKVSSYFDLYTSTTDNEDSFWQIVRCRGKSYFEACEGKDGHYISDIAMSEGMYARYIKLRMPSNNNDGAGIAEVTVRGGNNGSYNLIEGNKFVSAVMDVRPGSKINGDVANIVNGKTEGLENSYYTTVYDGGWGMNNYKWYAVIDLGDMYNLESIYVKWFYRLARANPDEEGLEYEVLYSDKYRGGSPDDFKPFATGSEMENSIVRYCANPSAPTADSPIGFSITGNHAENAEICGRYIAVRVTTTGRRIGNLWADTGVFEMDVFGSHIYDEEYRECEFEPLFSSDAEQKNIVDSLENTDSLYVGARIGEGNRIAAAYYHDGALREVKKAEDGEVICFEEDFSEGDYIEAWAISEDTSPISETALISYSAPTEIEPPPISDDISGGWLAAGFEEDRIRVQLSAGSAFAGKLVSVSMTPEEGSGDFSESCYIKTVRFDSDGNADICTRTNAPTGKYMLSLCVNGLSHIYAERTSLPIDFVNTVRMKRAVKDLMLTALGNEPEKGLDKAFETELTQSLNLDLSLYESLSDKTFICERLVEYLTKVNEEYKLVLNSDFSDENYEKMDNEQFCANLQREVNMYGLLAGIRESSEGREVNSILKNNQTYFESDEYFNLKKYPVYERNFLKWTDAMKAVSLSKLCGKDIRNEQQFEDAFVEAIMLGGIETAEYWGDVKLMMTDITAAMENPPSYTVGSSYEADVYKKLMRQHYDSYEAAKKDEKKWLDYYTEQAEQNKRGGSASGGGSGRGASQSVVISSEPKSAGAEEISGTNTEVNTEEPVQTIKFKDLAGYDWALPMIYALYDQGIINGVSEDRFAPADYVKREEILKMISLAFGVNDTSAVCHFSDVPEDCWSYPYIASAFELGLVKGMGDGKFGYGLNITRQDLAVMCFNYLNAYGLISVTQSDEMFEDNDEIAEYARNAVMQLKLQGLIKGNENNCFEPERYATRAEAACMISNIAAFSKTAAASAQ